MQKSLMVRLMENQLDFCDKLADLVDSQAEWSQATFGTDETRDPRGALLHLAEEAGEAIEAIGTPEFTKEVADCFLLVLDAARRGGMTVPELLDVAVAKHAVNKSREWPVPSTNDPVHHVR